MGEQRLTWHKASRSNSNGGNCVEVAASPGRVLVRDSKDPDGPRLSVTRAEWRSFLSDLARP